MHAIPSVLHQPQAQSIEERPRADMAAAGVTDIPQPFGIAQDAQPLAVYLSSRLSFHEFFAGGNVGRSQPMMT